MFKNLFCSDHAIVYHKFAWLRPLQCQRIIYFWMHTIRTAIINFKHNEWFLEIYFQDISNFIFSNPEYLTSVIFWSNLKFKKVFLFNFYVAKSLRAMMKTQFQWLMEPREKALQQQVAITKSELFKKFKNSQVNI